MWLEVVVGLQRTIQSFLMDVSDCDISELLNFQIMISQQQREDKCKINYINNSALSVINLQAQILKANIESSILFISISKILAYSCKFCKSSKISILFLQLPGCLHSFMPKQEESSTIHFNSSTSILFHSILLYYTNYKIKVQLMASVLKQTQPKSFIRNDVPDSLEDLLARLRKKVKEERIRVNQFLREFDKLRSGTITKEQLRVGLNMSKIVLSEAEFGLLIDAFSCPDKPGYVRVKDFVDSIDEVFTKKLLEKTSPKEVFHPASTQYKYGKQEPTQEEYRLAEQAKQRFREFARSNRLDIKQFFQDWDKLHRNKISPKQFRQVLATNYFELSEEEFGVLSKVYGTQEGQVRYIDFLNDTKPWNFDYLNQTKEQWKHGTGQPKQIPETVKGILEELRRLTKVKRVRYKEYLQDFDPLRKGLVTKNKFVGVIFQTMKLTLDERILKALEVYYEDPNDRNMVRYLDFLDDIDIVFTLPERQKDPLTTPPVFDYSMTKSGFMSGKETSDEQQLQRFMCRLGQVVRKHRLLLKPHFQDKDIAKSGKVLFSRMRAILDYNKLPLTQRQFQILCKRFNHEDIQFNYAEFIQLLNKYEQLN